jgi:F-type H+-transporting ATPase subunit gamma
MAALQGIKRRIKSVRGIHQITKAQQLVAASKLRRVQMAATGPQEYTKAIRELLAHQSAQPSVNWHPLYEVRPVKQALTIIVAGDRGMAGAYNSNIFRALSRHLREQGVPQTAIAIGKKASVHVAHAADMEELASYNVSGGGPVDSGVAQPVLQEILDLFLDGQIDAVHLLYTQFVSTVKQEVVLKQLLPIPKNPNGYPGETEPEPDELLDVVARRALEAEVVQAVLEARASEEAARMVAMMNATDNASDLITDLTLTFNNARQANITQELAEISAGADAITA